MPNPAAEEQLAKRQIEINEWTYNNRMETLFVFQILFISLMIVAILMYLRGAGFIGALFMGYVILLLVAVVIIIIVNRSMYTNRIRHNRFWSKRRFEDDNKMVPSTGYDSAANMAYLAQLRGQDSNSVCARCPK
jgi:hypothetical protein